MVKIKNSNYRKFLDEGEIQILSPDMIEEALNNINKEKRYIKEKRAFLIASYFSGARPNETLRLKPIDFSKEDSYILVKFKGSKRGLSRTIYLRYSNPMVKELWKYSRTIFDNAYLFYHLWSNYKRKKIDKYGKVYYLKEISGKLRYYFNKWFEGVIDDAIPPYYLRHSRFSALMQKDATHEEIRQLKGAKTIASVFPYSHMSSRSGKKMAKKIN
jgi:site-specific recombinase XerD